MTFPSPTGNPLYSRTYRRDRETWESTTERCVAGLKELGLLTEEEIELIRSEQNNYRAMVSGRWLWVGGTDWASRSENYTGGYNCSSMRIDSFDRMGYAMNLLMQGCGVGTVLTQECISQLPQITTRINSLKIIGEPGDIQRMGLAPIEKTIVNGGHIIVGDSRQGWCDAYLAVLEASASGADSIDLEIELTHVRPQGTEIKGFGGKANPVGLPSLFERMVGILNKAIGRKLNSVEVCLLLDWAAMAVVAGNIRRCLPFDALVHTSRGLIPIENVQVGDMVQTPIGFRKVVNKFDQGIQNVYEIETNAAFPRATLSHRVAVMGDSLGSIEWKSVNDLTPDDRLIHNYQILPGHQTQLPRDFTQERPENSRNAKSFTVPVLNTDVAWLIGYTHGNGYVSVGRNKYDKPFGAVSWAMNGSSDLLEQIRSKIDTGLAWFELNATHSIVKQENTSKSVCSSIRFAEYCFEYIKQPKRSIQIPDFILQGSIDIRSAYLAGLMDSDGCINGRPPTLVATIYKSFARQVAAVLSSLGIASRTHQQLRKEIGWSTLYNVNIPAMKYAYNSLIAIHSVKGKISEGELRKGFTFASGVLNQTYTYSELRKLKLSGDRTVALNYDRWRVESKLEADVPVTFTGLGSFDCVQTYDIEVEEAHCFYCDGYLTHNSANMRQFDRTDTLAANIKQNLWQTDERGNWYIDPELDALRMGNHTRIFFAKPTLENCIDSVRAQYKSGEGAIMWAGEAVARANADLLYTQHLKQNFLMCYERDINQAKQYLSLLTDEPMSDRELEHRLDRYGVNPCGEILGCNFFCNLSDVHLNQLDPADFEAQKWAFTAAGLSAAVLLHHKFDDERMQYSREIDPIVGVSFTGLFDFFVSAFGVDWLKWWQAGRPKSFRAHCGISIEIKQACSNFGIELDRYDGDGGWDLGSLYHDLERAYLSSWRHVVEETVWDYCDRAGLRHPNRCTTVQPSGSKSLLTGSSPGWHPPKAQRYIRRMTFGRDNPVALACIDYGYNVIPSQSDKDEHGNLLDDAFDPRCTEWLIEIPIEVPWANITGVGDIEIEKFSALAQYDFWIQVQKYYTAHNTSSTIELREHEIEELGARIYKSIRDNEGYISSALLARFNYDRQIFPRLPFEPIDKETFDRLSAEVLARRKGDDFAELLDRYDSGHGQIASGPNACDSERCTLPAA